MTNYKADYSNTVIYKIECKDSIITDIYIGHTTCFYQRERLHKSNCTNENSKGYNYKIYKIIRANGSWDNWKMTIIENYPCDNIEEARERERYWIEKEKSTLNVTIPNRSKKEYEKIYRIIHKEEIAEKGKEYRENNKDKIKQYIEDNKEKISFQKQDWYEEKKDYILEKAKEHYDANKEQKIEYQKQYAVENKDKVKEYQEEYREKNKEKLSEQKKVYREEHKVDASKANKEWREANKDKIKVEKSQVIECECGHTYTFGNKHRHLQSKIHIAYQNQLEGKMEDVQSQIVVEEKNKLEQDKIAHNKQKQKEYRDKNAEKIKEIRKKHYDENKEHNKEQRKKYYDSHKQQIMEQNKVYIAENKEKIKEYKDNWYEKKKLVKIGKENESEFEENTIQSI